MRPDKNELVTSPATRIRTKPDGSITQVSGTFATPNATAMVPSGSRILSQSPPFSVKKAETASSVSSFTTVNNSAPSSRPCCSSANATSSGCSLRHGTHVELKKLSTTHDPFRRDRSKSPPPTSVDCTAGAGLPISGDSTSASPRGFETASTTKNATKTKPTTGARRRDKRGVTSRPDLRREQVPTLGRSVADGAPETPPESCRGPSARHRSRAT